MIYGLHLSASGIMASSYKQDVVANNLANAETPGFKRDIPLFQQRLTEAESARVGQGHQGWSDATLEQLGGGLFIAPHQINTAQGDMEATGAPLDVAIEGSGYFAVRPASGGDAAGGGDEAPALTRNGAFMVDRGGYLVLGSEQGQRVLGPDRQPIRLDPDGLPPSIGPDGKVSQGNVAVGRVGVFDVADPQKVQKLGGTLLTYPDPAGVRPVDAPVVRSEFLERSNVDATTELTELMKTQRLLEANAQMIRYQDQTLGKLIEVGKIG